VYIRFVIDSHGAVTDVEVIKELMVRSIKKQCGVTALMRRVGNRVRQPQFARECADGIANQVST